MTSVIIWMPYLRLRLASAPKIPSLLNSSPTAPPPDPLLFWGFQWKGGGEGEGGTEKPLVIILLCGMRISHLWMILPMPNRTDASRQLQVNNNSNSSSFYGKCTSTMYCTCTFRISYCLYFTAVHSLVTSRVEIVIIERRLSVFSLYLFLSLSLGTVQCTVRYSSEVVQSYHRWFSQTETDLTLVVTVWFSVFSPNELAFLYVLTVPFEVVVVYEYYGHS